MNKILLPLSLMLVFALTACQDVEKQASRHLQAARQAFDEGRYNEAKLQIDSIKINFPKAFETRRAGIRLMQQVELKEQLITLAYLDSMLQVQRQELNRRLSNFVLEKDTAYQRIGNYFHPSQVVEKNLHRSFLRFQVDERGVMDMTSIYCGNAYIHHSAVKVTAPDGTFAQTPPSKDSYETDNLGQKIEQADFRLGSDGNVMGFIYLNRDKPLRVEYLGDRRYTYPMNTTDRQALAAIYELSQLLSSITRLEKDQKESLQKKSFVERKMTEH
ncbi:MAG: hypothetical protein LBM06_06095 [Prevotellaceae bacterium]|jgi:hypothetical protein|nr:hypothetical protein [Prevotellaceae bacterium]